MQPNTYVNELAYAHTLVSYTQDYLSNILTVVYLSVRTEVNKLAYSHTHSCPIHKII